MSEPSEERLREIYRTAKTIAVVGASAEEHKDAHQIPLYLQKQGYRIIPVNPRGGTIWGEPVATSLGEITEPIDVVQVFRPSEETPGIARQAVAAGAKVLWLQSGISNDEAEQIASDGGLEVVMDMCMRATHRLLGLDAV